MEFHMYESINVKGDNRSAQELSEFHVGFGENISKQL
jgi:hypothetical protein